MIKLLIKKIKLILLVLILSCSGFVVKAEEQNLPQNPILQTKDMKDGVILHAWGWSFKSISENMEKIKNAGYTSVQTSPINKVIEGKNGDLSFENWYFHYQPAAYTIGNYQLGSEEDFIEMNKIAEQHGIRIIVDAVLNHTTTDEALDLVSDEIKNIPNWTHGNAGILDGDWGNRKKVTQNALLGLYDMNTQNPQVQKIQLDFLKKAVKLGADGFRYDAAKHIEIPQEYPIDGTSDFWNVILNNGSEFQYGEILTDAASRDEKYAELMSITASNYGKTILEGLKHKSISTGNIMNFNTNVTPSKLVTWVESHDNYANTSKESVWMSDTDIILGWALVAGRFQGTPLFFSRPKGGGETVQFDATMRLGNAGSDLYYHPSIREINIFHNTMNGEDEYLRQINNNTQLVMIERGTKGAILVNLGDSDVQFSVDTRLATGAYQDKVNIGNTLNVEGNQLKGTLKKRSVSIIYNNTTTTSEIDAGVKGYEPERVNNFNTKELELTLQKTNNLDKAEYQIDGGNAVVFNDGDRIKIGNLFEENSLHTLKVTGYRQGEVKAKTYRFFKENEEKEAYIYFTNPENWQDVYIYAYVPDPVEAPQVFGEWPGKLVTEKVGDKYRIKISSEWLNRNTHILFNNNNNRQFPSTNGFLLENNAVYGASGKESILDHIEIKEEIKETELDFNLEEENDNTKFEGEIEEITPGTKGVKKEIFDVTYKNGIEQTRTLKDIQITNPINRKIKKGTRPVVTETLEWVSEEIAIPDTVLEETSDQLFDDEVREFAGEKGSVEKEYRVIINHKTNTVEKHFTGNKRNEVAAKPKRKVTGSKISISQMLEWESEVLNSAEVVNETSDLLFEDETKVIEAIPGSVEKEVKVTTNHKTSAVTREYTGNVRNEVAPKPKRIIKGTKPVETTSFEWESEVLNSAEVVNETSDLLFEDETKVIEAIPGSVEKEVKVVTNHRTLNVVRVYSGNTRNHIVAQPKKIITGTKKISTSEKVWEIEELESSVQKNDIVVENGEEKIVVDVLNGTEEKEYEITINHKTNTQTKVFTGNIRNRVNSTYTTTKLIQKVSEKLKLDEVLSQNDIERISEFNYELLDVYFVDENRPEQILSINQLKTAIIQPKKIDLSKPFSLYHINKDKQLEKVEYQIVGNEVVFKNNQFSPYLLVSDEKKIVEANQPTSSTKNTVETGDFTSMMILIMLGAGITLLVLRKRKSY